MSDEFDEWLRPDERRVEVRLNTICKVYLPMGDDVTGEPSMICCEAIDFSTNGVQVKSEIAVPQSAILPVVIDVNNQSFSLVCEVMWCRQKSPESPYLIGLHLLDSDDSSVVEWKEAMITWLSSDVD